MSEKYNRYLSAKKELETSLANAKSLRDQWLAATRENPTNMSKRELDTLTKTFRNRLLTVKWDFEDLEELLDSSNTKGNALFDHIEQHKEAKSFNQGCQKEISELMDQLEQGEANVKALSRHGISIYSDANATSNSSAQNFTEGDAPESLANIVSENEPEDILIDKRQIDSPKASIFVNALHDHYDDTTGGNKFDTSQVFNNLSRPITNVYVNPNDNEMILNMLETEYYNPPATSSSGRKYIDSIKKAIEYDPKNFIKAIALLFSFPMLLIIFFIL